MGRFPDDTTTTAKSGSIWIPGAAMDDIDITSSYGGFIVEWDAAAPR